MNNYGAAAGRYAAGAAVWINSDNFIIIHE